MMLKSWTSPKTQKNQPSQIAGNGFFAIADIQKGEIVAIKVGHVIDHETLLANQQIIKDSQAEIAEGFYLAPLSDEEMPQSMIYINHSCEPNVGIGGNVLMVAIRDIAAGEELTFDYAMEFTHPDFKMVCNCQKQSCRKVITGNDWELPRLQENYGDYLSWHIQQKIKKTQVL